MEISVINRKRGKRFVQKEFTPEQQMKGVMFWLYDKGHRDATSGHKVIREFSIWSGLNKNIPDTCCEIQKCFTIFTTWYNERYKSDSRGNQIYKI